MTTPFKLVEKRFGHLCWNINGNGGEILLLGGWNSESTELISGGTSSANFNLQYITE